MILGANVIGYIEKVVQDSLVVFCLDHKSEDVLDDRSQFPKLRVAQLDFAVDASLKFVQKIVGPSHLLEYQASGFLVAMLLFF
jgi:hypothetical protein